MRKISILFVMFLLGNIMYSQNGNVILFSADGNAFYAELNALRINAEAVRHLKIEALSAPNYKLKVIFMDETLGSFEKNLLISPGNEITYNIKKSNQGEWKLGYVSETPIAQAPVQPSSVTVIQYGAPAPAPVTTTTVVEEKTTVTNTGTSTGSATSVGTGVSTGTGTSDNVNMSMDIGGVGMNVNVNVTETGTSTGTGTNMGTGTYNSMDEVTSTTTTTTTTTTTSSGYTGTQTNDVLYQPATTTVECPVMSDADFESAKASVRNKSFEDSKLTMTQQILKSNCATSLQIKGFMELFSFEDTKLEFAKWAYPYCLDVNNYYKVNDAFDFESSIEELEQYLSSQR